MSNTCNTFSPLFRFHRTSRVATKFTFTSENSLILVLHKRLPSNATKKILVKMMEDKLEEALSDVLRDVEMFNWDASFYSVSEFLKNFPHLPLCTSLVFSVYR